MDLTKVSLRAYGRRVTLNLPVDDHVTRSITTTNDFYERGLLDDIMRRTRPGDTVVDVGAYIGTHTIFLSAVAGLKVIAIEPNPESLRILESNVAENHVSDRVELHNVAIGANEGLGSLVIRDEHNLGMTAIKPGEGSIDIKTLDTVISGRSVKVMKIDIEGMEPDAIRGASEVISKHRPALYVEVADLAMEREVTAVLEPLGYRYVREFNATPTQLYLPTEHVAPSLYPDSLAEQAQEQAYVMSDVIKQLTNLARRVDALRVSINQLADRVGGLESHKPGSDVSGGDDTTLGSEEE
jgi:FkbM family methyltransferase